MPNVCACGKNRILVPVVVVVTIVVVAIVLRGDVVRSARVEDIVESIGVVLEIILRKRRHGIVHHSVAATANDVAEVMYRDISVFIGLHGLSS